MPVKVVAPENAVATAFDEYFDPEKYPYLSIGTVTDQLFATKAQIESAKRKRDGQRKKWQWRLFDGADDSFDAIKSQLSKLVDDAKASLEAEPSSTRDSATVGSDTTAPLNEYGQTIMVEKPQPPTAEMLSALVGAIPTGRIAWRPLPFYAGNARLIHIDDGNDPPRMARRFVITSDYSIGVELFGQSPIIHGLNKQLNIEISDATVEDYLSFFCEHVHGDDGPFYTIERDEEQADRFPESLNIATRDPRIGPALGEQLSKFKTAQWPGERQSSSNRRAPTEVAIRTQAPERYAKAEIGWPLTCTGVDDKDRRIILGTILYAEIVFRAAFAVAKTGFVEMMADQPVEPAEITAIHQLWPVMRREDPR